jgi:hypothetical protein
MGPEWSVYDRLLAELPADERVSACLVGSAWTLVEAQGVGMAMSFHDDTWQSCTTSRVAGRPLAQVAAQLTSWNLAEAAIGLAALNAHYNARDRVEQWLGRRIGDTEDSPVFRSLEDEVAGKKVGVVGHFPGLERLAARCRLTIFERRPQPGDLPDYAEDYVLPAMDWVLITGTALTNKTLPHLLAITHKARVVLVGPSVPLTPLWFELGVHMLAGSVVTDKDRLWPVVQEGSCFDVFRNGVARIQVRADAKPRRGPTMDDESHATG